MTVNVYAVPFVNPDTVHDNGPVDQPHVAPPGDAVTVYPEIASPPSSDGADHDTVTSPSPRTPDTPVGAPGARANFAETERACVIDTTQVVEPEQSPLHPTNDAPEVGVADNVTSGSFANTSAQSSGQDTPARFELTEPSPTTDTDSTWASKACLMLMRGRENPRFSSGRPRSRFECASRVSTGVPVFWRRARMSSTPRSPPVPRA